jgi:phage tail-like protein
MYNTDGKPVARYHLEHAWPAKLEIGTLGAGRTEVLTESVTLVCEHLQRLASTD